MEYYTNVLKNYAEFRGRAGRTEFWVFMGINAAILAAIAGNLLVIEWLTGLALYPLFAVLAGVYSLGVLMPSIAVSVRRLHDTGKSARTWLQLVFVPIVGPIALLYVFLEAGQIESNAYGPIPHGAPRQLTC